MKTKTKTLLQHLKTKTKNTKTKTKKDSIDHHALLEDQYGGSRCQIRRSVAMLTMLAHVNYLILPPLIALNQIVSFFQRIF